MTESMKIAASILITGILIAGAIYAGLTDGRRTYMNGCTETGSTLGQSEAHAERYCAFTYNR